MSKRPPHYKPYDTSRVIKLDLRGSRHERGYDNAWYRLRDYHIRKYPVCCVEDCGQAAVEIDHIVPVSVDPRRRLDPTNLQSLCKSHHALKTWKERKGK